MQEESKKNEIKGIAAQFKELTGIDPFAEMVKKEKAAAEKAQASTQKEIEKMQKACEKKESKDPDCLLHASEADGVDSAVKAAVKALLSDAESGEKVVKVHKESVAEKRKRVAMRLGKPKSAK